jgi:hypothetical protein
MNLFYVKLETTFRRLCILSFHPDDNLENANHGDRKLISSSRSWGWWEGLKGGGGVVEVLFQLWWLQVFMYLSKLRTVFWFSFFKVILEVKMIPLPTNIREEIILCIISKMFEKI